MDDRSPHFVSHLISKKYNSDKFTSHFASSPLLYLIEADCCILGWMVNFTTDRAFTSQFGRITSRQVCKAKFLDRKRDLI